MLAFYLWAWWVASVSAMPLRPKSEQFNDWRVFVVNERCGADSAVAFGATKQHSVESIRVVVVTALGWLFKLLHTCCCSCCYWWGGRQNSGGRRRRFAMLPCCRCECCWTRGWTIGSAMFLSFCVEQSRRTRRVKRALLAAESADRRAHRRTDWCRVAALLSISRSSRPQRASRRCSTWPWRHACWCDTILNVEEASGRDALASTHAQTE